MNNDLVSNFFNFYKQIESPGYAVLVKGEWGTGKTYKVVNELGMDNIYYTSLFGLSSQQEIYSAVFLSMFPAKSVIPKITARIKDALKGTEKITFGVPGIVNGVAEAFIREKVKKDKVIVFDDLERANLDLNKILGCINKYVEHHQCRVIVIAHDEIIQEELNKVKEKIFGQILLIEPNIKEAHHAFIKKSGAPAAAKEIEDYILSAFCASKCQSLRILKQSIDDCLRLYSCLEKKHIEKKAKIKALILMFCGISISFRNGKITKEDIKARSKVAYMDFNIKNDTEKSSYGKMKDLFRETMAEIDFDSRILSDDILENTICNGFYNKKEITKYLDESHHFSDPLNSPAWVTLMNFDKLDDNSIKAALVRIDKEEDAFDITDIGDILHTFSLKCMLIMNGEIDEDYEELENKYKNYVSELLLNDKLPPSTKDARETHEEQQDNAHGYAYWIKDEYRVNFERLAKFITNTRDLALEKKYPSYGNEVLELLKTDLREFREAISAGPYSFGKYSNMPVLKTISPSKFVKTWLSISREDWLTVKTALESRYNWGMLKNYLSDEEQWIIAINQQIRIYASYEKGLSRLRIMRLVLNVPLNE